MGQQFQVEEQEDDQIGSDLEDEMDDFMDEESEKIMRTLKEARLAGMKANYQEQQENKTMGHGTY